MSKAMSTAWGDMIEDCANLQPLLETGEADLVWAKIDGQKKALGLHIRRGHIAVRDGRAFPVVGGQTSILNFEEVVPAKCAELLVAPLRETGELKDVVFVPGSANYYHFLAFNLPALTLIGPAVALLGAERPTLAMSRGMPLRARALMTRLLPRCAGGQAVAIADIPEGDYAVRNAVFRLRPAPFLIGRAGAIVMQSVLKEAGISDPVRERGPVKLFVTRAGGVNGRNLANQAETQAWLEARGYVAVNPGDLPMEEQVLLFARATHIVGVEGAAMANLLFAANARGVIVLASATTSEEHFFSSEFANAASFTSETIFGAVRELAPLSRNTDFVVPLESLAEACTRLDM